MDQTFSYQLNGIELVSPNKLFAQIRPRARGNTTFLYNGKYYKSIFITKINIA